MPLRTRWRAVLGVDWAIGIELKGKSKRGQHAVEGIEQRVVKDADHPAAQDEKQQKAPDADAAVRLLEPGWKELAQDVAAIERRQRDEVEDEEQQVDEDAVVQQHGDRK